MSRSERLYRYLSKGFVFVIVLLVVFYGVNSLLQPIWFYENNYHTYRSFYKEPPNTIETVFVGASMTLFGFSPMEMYEQNGICSFNLASTSQPYMMSYYWIKEAERLHGETLDTVVLDVSMLRRTPQEEDYRKALDGMQWSNNKAEAINDLSDSFIDQITYRFPIFGYHDRWSQLDFTDFVKFDSDNIEDYTRGYYMEFNRIFDQFDIEEISVPVQVLDPEAAPAALEPESLFYLNKIIEFCQEEDLRLVFCKTPSPANWTSGEHNAIQQIADAYDVEFLDFEIDPLLSEIAYNPPLDSKDLGKHLNYYGAMKLTHYMGNYLAQTCGNRDVRGEKGYEHLDGQLRRYHDKVTLLAEATLTDDVGDCMTKIASATNYTMLVTIKGSASNYLTVEQRIAFDRLGLDGLSTLGPYDSYLAVVTDGEVEYQQIDRAPSDFANQIDHYLEEYKRLQQEEVAEVVEEEDDEEALNLDEIEQGEWKDVEELRQPIVRSGQFADGKSYTITSMGGLVGAISGCLIETEGEEEDVEYSLNKYGINLTVYDNDVHRVVYSGVFDTGTAAKRELPNLEALLTKNRYKSEEYARLTPDLKKLYRYKRRMDYGWEAKELRTELGRGGLYKYLQHFSREGLIVLIAVKDDASNALTDEAREALASMGLTEIRNLEYHGSYCAAIEDGVVVDQAISNDTSEQAMIIHKWYTIKSGGFYAGNMASIVIDDNGHNSDYASNMRGFNIVVYNPRLDIIVDRTWFDTCTVGVDL